MDSIRTQLNIRNNVTDMHKQFSDLYAWEAEIKSKDKALSNASNAQTEIGHASVRGKAASVSAAPSQLCKPSPALVPGHLAVSHKDVIKRNKKRRAKDKLPELTAAGHTYDYFKDRWDKFDVDAALAEVDEQSEYEESSNESSSSQGYREGPAEPPVPTTLAVPEDTAEGWRAKGNEYFKFGDMVKAKDCYTKSIAAEASASAHANRALVCTKLKEWDSAEADCTAALELDSMYLKAWQRRASVRENKDNLLGCLEDLDAAMHLAPASALIGRDVRSVMRRYAQQHGLELPALCVTVPVAVDADATPVAHTPDVSSDAIAFTSEAHLASARQEQATLGSEAGDDWVNVQHIQEHGDVVESQPIAAERAGAASDGTLHCDCGITAMQAAGQHAPKPMPSTACVKPSVAASLVGDTIKKMRQRLLPPLSASNFEATWRSLEGQETEKVKYLALLNPEDAPHIFKTLLTPKLLHGVAIAALEGIQQNGPECGKFVQILASLPKVQRFTMTAMLLTKGQKQDLRGCWKEALQQQLPKDDADLLSALKTIYNCA